MSKEITPIGIPTILTLIFVILKITKLIGWSWWWVLSPLWISFIIGFIISIIVGVIAWKS